MEICVRAEVSISAAHYLPDHPKCGAVHGHNYKVELWAYGAVTDGILVDFAMMKDQLEDVVKQYDHNGLLNAWYEYPSAEVLVSDWLRRLNLMNAKYKRLRVWETEKYYAEADITR